MAYNFNNLKLKNPRPASPATLRLAGHGACGAGKMENDNVEFKK